MNFKVNGHRSLKSYILAFLILSVLLSGCSGTPTSTSSLAPLSEPASIPTSETSSSAVTHAGEDADAVVIVAPAKFERDADEMEDSELLLMLENILYPNGMDAYT